MFYAERGPRKAVHDGVLRSGLNGCAARPEHRRGIDFGTTAVFIPCVTLVLS